ncbi:DUF4810 domain-containing protein [Sulfurimonas sp.]|uniref:DUF4810 domain-containing protein n=1 Tax=Sulfurimonas sp. TaxID=2022749 RepID=UPI0035673613
MKRLKIIAPIAIAFFMTGCVEQPKPLYNYGDYSDSYYASKKNICAESSLKLQKSIEKCIESTDGTLSGRVPPGMYANLGYIYLKGGNSEEAISSFTKEKTMYPESAHFMDRMIKKIKIAQGPKNDN